MPMTITSKMIRHAVGGLMLCVGSLQLKAAAQNAPRWVSKEEAVYLLNHGVSPHQVGQRAREQGIDFEGTPEVERDLRRASATQELPATLQELAPRPAHAQIRENRKDGLKYVWIPPGTFTMGCSPGDNECYYFEKPTHQVTITRGFWIGQTPVTVGAYRRFAGATGRPMPPEPNILGRALNPGWGNDAMPIVDVTWNDAQAYCRWAGGRLLTEAEWEYAARGGSTEARYGPIDDIAWYADNSGQQRLDSARIWNEDRRNYDQRLKDNGNRMHEVGLKRPNTFGLFDILGNVWQWVSDWCDPNYYWSSPSQDPRGPASGQMRVLRGGSWHGYARHVRVSYRNWGNPAHWDINNGFRCGGEVVNP
jgi:formylglycine-generating enzyme required for sulfatase activity